MFRAEIVERIVHTKNGEYSHSTEGWTLAKNSTLDGVLAEVCDYFDIGSLRGHFDEDGEYASIDQIENDQGIPDEDGEYIVTYVVLVAEVPRVVVKLK